MGYKTEINYILKASTAAESDELESVVANPHLGTVIVTKSGLRTFILESPIMLANSNWEIVGMGKIIKTEVSQDKTVLTAKVLTRFSPQERQIVSKVIQEAEQLK